MRVKYFSTYDLSIGHYIKIADEKLRANNFKNDDINDQLELYNIEQFFKNMIYLKTWMEKDIDEFEKITKDVIKNISNIFQQQINDKTILLFLGKIDREYLTDFWMLVEKLKSYKQISKSTFMDILLSNLYTYYILQNKKTVAYFGKEVRAYLLEYEKAAEYLLIKYEIEQFNKDIIYYFPKELSLADKKKIIVDYINSEEPNLSYLEIIAGMQSNKDSIELSKEILLLAKRRAQELKEAFFKENSGIPIEVKIAFRENMSEAKVEGINNFVLKADYLLDWIKLNKDFPTLFNNFIYLFNFVDLQGRILLLSNPVQMSVLEKHMRVVSKKEYQFGMSFTTCDMLSLAQIEGYYSVLEKLSTSFDGHV